MTYILIILKVQVRLKKKVSLFCKKNHIFKKRNISLYRDIFGAMHRYFQILYRPISNVHNIYYRVRMHFILHVYVHIILYYPVLAVLRYSRSSFFYQRTIKSFCHSILFKYVSMKLSIYSPYLKIFIKFVRYTPHHYLSLVPLSLLEMIALIR